jgi:hypothetical protein
MKSLLPIILAVLAMLTASALAQSPGELNAGSQVVYTGSSDSYSLSWWGVANSTYLIETSDDLVNWSYLPVVESGSDSVIEWGFTSTSSSLFMKLEYISVPANQLSAAVFNGPEDTSTGLPGDWELFYFGTLGVDSTLDPNGEGFTVLQDYENGNNPIADQVVSVGSSVGEYLFHETSGTIAHDISSLHNNAVLSGSAGWETGGYDGERAVTLGGTTGQILISDSANQVLPAGGFPFSFAFWFQPASGTSGTSTLISAGVSGTTGFQLYIDSTLSPPNLVFLTSGTNRVDLAAPIPTAGWTEAAVAYDGTSATIYVNGVQQVSGTGTLVSDTSSILLGKGFNGNRSFDGAMEDLTLYRAALHWWDVQSLYDISTTATGPDFSGIPNWWKYEFLGSLTANPSAFVTWSGSQLTIGQAYENGLNPTDFYSGAIPLLNIVSGSGLTGSPNEFIPAPLVVNVTGSTGTPLIDAPVTFTVTSGTGSLQTTGTGSSLTTVTVLTDLNGNAQVFYKLPNAPNNTSDITAEAGSSGSMAEVSFSEASDSGTGTYGSPLVPSNVFGSINPDGSEAVTWQNNDNNQGPIYIYLQTAPGTWSVTGSLAAGTTSYTASASIAGLIEVGNNYSPGGSTGTVIGGTDPGIKPIVGIPAQSYAVVDLSGTAATSDVTLIALDDSNNTSFAYMSDSNTLKVKQWSNGTVQTLQSVTIGTGIEYDTDDNGEVYRTMYLYPGALAPNGTLYGGAEMGYDYAEWGTEPSFIVGFASTGGSTSLTVENDDVIFDPLEVDESIFTSSAGIGTATNNSFAGRGRTAFSGGKSFGFVSSSTANTYFTENSSTTIPSWLPSGTAVYGPGNFFLTLGLNDEGSMIFYNQASNEAQTDQLWNGSSLVLLSFVPTSINHQGSIVGNLPDVYDNPTGTPVIWEQGTSSTGTTTTFSALTGPPILHQALSEIGDIYPQMLSNAKSTDNSTRVLFNSDNPNDGYVLTLSASNQLSQVSSIQLPAGVTISNYKNINSSGLIAALGEPSAAATTEHALLLLPVDFTYNEVLSNPEVFNYIPTGTVGTPKLDTDITVTTQPSTAVTISGTPTGVFTPSSGSTSGTGTFNTTFSTKNKNSMTFNLTVESGTATSGPHQMLPAYYQSTFTVTGYYTPNETTFSGPTVTSTTLTTGYGTSRWKQYNISSPVAAKADFLQAVAIEGEGYLANGTHIVAHNKTQIGTSSPRLIKSTIVTDTQQPQGTYAPLVDGQSCAVTVGGPVPPKALIYVVDDQDQRSADEVVAGNELGGLYHIDLYCGFDKSYAGTISETDHVVLENY